MSAGTNRTVMGEDDPRAALLAAGVLGLSALILALAQRR